MFAGDCQDSTRYCEKVRQLELCPLPQFKARCCRSCRDTWDSTRTKGQKQRLIQRLRNTCKPTTQPSTWSKTKDHGVWWVGVTRSSINQPNDKWGGGLDANCKPMDIDFNLTSVKALINCILHFGLLFLWFCIYCLSDGPERCKTFLNSLDCTF